MPCELKVILLDPTQTLKPGKNTAIRSQSMQGKNKREDSRRSKRERNKISKEKRRSDAEKSKHTCTSNTPILTHPLDLTWLPSSSILLPPTAQNLLLHACTYTTSHHLLFPLDRYVDYDCARRSTIQWFSRDAAFLHSLLYAAHAVSDFASPGWDGRMGRQTAWHLQWTLGLLKGKIGTGDVCEEAVVYVIANLAVCAAVFGDWEAVRMHVGGLRRVVGVRGGRGFLGGRPRLRFKLDRLDLMASLSSGTKPSLLPLDIYPSPIPRLESVHDDMYQPPTHWAPQLASIFRDFQHVAQELNFRVREHGHYAVGFFQDLLSRLQMRLAHLTDELTRPEERLMRLVLLAFLTTTFKLPGRKVGYMWIAKELERAWEGTARSPESIDPALRMWIVMVATISVVDDEPAWLLDAWYIYCTVIHWRDMKAQLVNVMWIECMHDDPGQYVFKHFAESRCRDTWKSVHSSPMP